MKKIYVVTIRHSPHGWGSAGTFSWVASAGESCFLYFPSTLKSLQEKGPEPHTSSSSRQGSHFMVYFGMPPGLHLIQPSHQSGPSWHTSGPTLPTAVPAIQPRHLWCSVSQDTLPPSGSPCHQGSPSMTSPRIPSSCSFELLPACQSC